MRHNFLWKRILAGAVLGAVLSAPSLSFGQDTVNVAGSSPGINGDYATIQAAINALPPDGDMGDQVRITISANQNTLPTSDQIGMAGTGAYRDGLTSLTLLSDTTGTMRTWNAAGTGRFLRIENTSNIYILNMEFLNGHHITSSGGALRLGAGKTFDGEWQGLVDATNLNEIALDNVIFRDNTIDLAVGHPAGGALLVMGGVSGSGGTAADYAKTTGTLSLTDVDFYGNKAIANANDCQATGGGLRLVDVSSLIYAGGTVMKNSAISNGVSTTGDTFAAGGGVKMGAEANARAVFSGVNVLENLAHSVHDAAIGGGVEVHRLYEKQDVFTSRSGFYEVAFDQGTVIADNMASAMGAGSHAAGGGVAVRGAVALDFDHAFVSGNTALSDSGDALGGGVAIIGDPSNEAEFWALGKLTVSDTIFEGNTAEGVRARGGAVSLTASAMTTDTPVFTNVSMLDNSALGAEDARGGAIATDKDIVIRAEDGYSIFRGNAAWGGSTALGNSIYSTADLTYDTVGFWDFIADFDGIHVTGTVTKTGSGALLFGGDTVHDMGQLDVQDGTLISFIYEDMSNIYVDGTLGSGNGSGSFAQGSNWYVGMFGVDQDGVDLLRGAGIRVTTDGWADLGDVNAALIDNDPLYHIFADNNDFGDGVLRIAFRDKALVSDVYNTAYLMHRWNTIRNASNDRIDRGFAKQRLGECALRCAKARCNAAEETGCAKKTCCLPKLSTHSLWVNYVGRSSELESSYARFGGGKYDMTSHGVQLGVDLITTRCVQFGIMFGYEDMENKLARDRVEGEDYYFGLYGARMLECGYDVRGMFGYGRQNYDVSRYHYSSVSDVFNRMYGVSPDGRTFEGNIELGRRIYKHCVSYRPYIGLDYLNNDIDGAYEGLGGFNYAGGKFEQLFVRIGTDLQLRRGRWDFNGGASYSYQMLSDGEEVSTGISRGLMQSTLRSCDLGNSVISLNAGANYAFGSPQGWNLYGGYFGDIYADRDGSPMHHTGVIGLQRRF